MVCDRFAEIKKKATNFNSFIVSLLNQNSLIMKQSILFLAIVTFIFASCSKDNPSPVAKASFEISSEELFLEQELTFTNTSENATSFEWNFGDGTESNEKDPVHKYSTAGNFTITLKVDDSKTATKSVIVHDADRAVYFSNNIESDLDITLFDRISANQIGTVRYKLGVIASGAKSDTLYIKNEALGIAGIQDDILPFVIFDPLTFELEKGKINELEINSDTKVVYGLALPE